MSPRFFFQGLSLSGKMAGNSKENCFHVNVSMALTSTHSDRLSKEHKESLFQRQSVYDQRAFSIFFCFFVSKLLRYYTPLALVFGECTSNRWKMDRQHLRSVVTFHFCWGLRRRRCVWRTFFQVYRNGAPDQDRSVSPTWVPRNLSFELILFRPNFPPDCQSWVRKITPLLDKS